MRLILALTAVTLLMTIAVLNVQAQQCSPAENEVASTMGFPCSYDIDSASGDVGCWADATCYNGKYLQTSWYQQWSCSSGTLGHVHAFGGNSEKADMFYCPATEDYYIYTMGIESSGRAVVWDEGGVQYASFGGWERHNCKGEYSYSGPYSYWC